RRPLRHHRPRAASAAHGRRPDPVPLPPPLAARPRPPHRGVRRPRPGAAPRRRPEGDPVPLRRRPRPARPLPARGGDHRPPRAPRSRADLQPGHLRRRPAVPRHAPRPGRDAQGRHPPLPRDRRPGPRPPPPGTAAPPAGTMVRARAGKVRPARQVEPSAPRALEAVCAKALAAQPRDRYRGAAELAAEVERYLAGEPVEAYPEPLPDRLTRLAGRHRLLAAAAVALLFLAVMVLSAVCLLLLFTRERPRTADQTDRGRPALSRTEEADTGPSRPRDRRQC